MAINVLAIGTPAEGGSGTLSFLYPTSVTIVQGQLLLLVIVGKYPAFAGSFPQNPSGWKLLPDGMGYGGTVPATTASDTGSAGVFFFYKIAEGNEAVTLGVTVTHGGAATSGRMLAGFIVQFSIGASKKYLPKFACGAQNYPPTLNISIVTNKDPGFSPGDLVFYAFGANNDAIDYTNVGLSIPGVTLGTQTLAGYAAAAGQDAALIYGYAEVVSGTSSGPATFSATANGVVDDPVTPGLSRTMGGLVVGVFKEVDIPTAGSVRPYGFPFTGNRPFMASLMPKQESGNFSTIVQTGYFEEEATTGYTLPVTSQTIAFSGKTIGLTAQKGFSVDSLAVPFSGKTINFAKGYSFSVDRLTIPYNAQTISFLRGLRMPVTHQAIPFTGRTINFQRGLRMVVTHQTLTFAGQTINFKRGLRFVIDRLQIAYSGKTINLIYAPVGSYVLPVTALSIPFAAQTIGLLKGKKLGIDALSIAYSGKTINLVIHRQLTIEGLIIPYSGKVINFIYGEPQSYALTISRLVIPFGGGVISFIAPIPVLHVYGPITEVIRLYGPIETEQSLSGPITELLHLNGPIYE